MKNYSPCVTIINHDDDGVVFTVGEDGFTLDFKKRYPKDVLSTMTFNRAFINETAKKLSVHEEYEFIIYSRAECEKPKFIEISKQINGLTTLIFDGFTIYHQKGGDCYVE